MKKYFYMVLVLIFILMLIFIILTFTKKEENNCVDNIDLKEIYNSINSSTGIMFEEIDSSSMIDYLGTDIDIKDDYILATNVQNKDEFYFIAKGLSKDQLSYLNEFVDLKKENSLNDFKNTAVNNYNNFTYVSFSDEHNYIIEGVIRSYLYCKRES